MSDDNEKSAQINQLFKKVVALPTIEAFSYLNSSKNNPEIVEEVVKLLTDYQSRQTYFVDQPDMQNVLQPVSDFENPIGKTIGDIKILEVIGKGGMGQVYLGMDQKLQRKVAVKTIRGLYKHHPETRERFRKEALILSSLDHPGVCKIYNILELGDTDYLILEYIEGNTLSKQLVKRWRYREKLRFARKILHGIQAAHDKGVIHRDIKPDNILVTSTRQVKILDFGISASLSTRKESKDDSGNQNLSHETNHQQIMGTVGYMSPEQAHGKTVDASSDIFALGVLFQEIFSGESAQPVGLELEEMLERAKQGQTLEIKHTPAAMSHLISRMKSREPSARPAIYDVIVEIDRIIDQPKRRIRYLTIATAIMAGLLGLLKYTYDLNKEKNIANQQRLAAEQAKNEAEQVTQFLESIFQVSDPYSNIGNEVTARQILDQGAERIDQDLQDQPMSQSRLKLSIGQIYTRLGLFKAARKQLTEALNTIRSIPEKDVALQVQLIDKLAVLEYEESNFKSMEQLLAEGIDLIESNGMTDMPQYLSMKFNYAAAISELLRHDEAIEQFQSLLDLYNQQPERFRLELVTTYNYLGLIKSDNHDNEGGIADLQKALKLLDPDEQKEMEYKTALYSNMGSMYRSLGNYEKAAELNLKTAALREKVLGHQHPLLAITYDNVAKNYCEADQLSLCKDYVDKALHIFETNEHTNNADYAKTIGTKALLLDHTGENQPLAEQLWLKSIQLLKNAYGNQHFYVANHHVNLGHHYFIHKVYELALKQMKIGIEMYEQLNRNIDGQHLDAWLTVIKILQTQKNHQQVIKTYEELLEKLRQQQPNNEEQLQKIKAELERIRNTQ